MLTRWDYGLIEETFAKGREPRIVTFGDGTKAMMTNWLTDDYCRIGIYSTPTTLAWLSRWTDDVGACCYRWTECDQEEYFKWMDECRMTRMVLKVPPSYHEQDAPDFIGEELWKEYHG
jgi:hypothetical protein